MSSNKQNMDRKRSFFEKAEPIDVSPGMSKHLKKVLNFIFFQVSKEKFLKMFNAQDWNGNGTIL